MYTCKIQPPDGKRHELIIIAEPKEELMLNFWIPYEKLGLELVDADNPPVPDTVLLSGTFSFDEGTSRKFSIEPCDMYTVDVILQSGGLKIYSGSSNSYAEIRSDGTIPYRYKAKYDWEYAPYLRFVGIEDSTEATIHAEMLRR